MAIRIPELDVGEVRRATGLSIEDFANRFGLRPEAIRNWEEGTSQPYKVARILLAIIAIHPEVVDEVLRVPEQRRFGPARVARKQRA